MTRHLVMTLSVILVFAAAGFGQGFEAFGGYSYSHIGNTATSLLTGAEGAHGFTGSLTGNLNQWLGFTGELDYHGRSETATDVASGLVADVNGKRTSFRFGPRFTSRINDSVSTFAHVLAGGTWQSVNGNDPETGLNSSVSAKGFSTVAGGGLDLRVSPRIAVRPVQIDWEHLGSVQVLGENTGSSNGLRYSAGIVIRF